MDRRNDLIKCRHHPFCSLCAAWTPRLALGNSFRYELELQLPVRTAEVHFRPQLLVHLRVAAAFGSMAPKVFTQTMGVSVNLHRPNCARSGRL